MPDDPGRPAAGWYADPHSDAERLVPVALATDAKDLRDGARRAKVAVLVGVPFYAATPALEGQQVRQTRRAADDLREHFAQLERDSQNPIVPGVQVRPFPTAPTNAVGPLLALPALVIIVLFLIWFHRAATIAAGLGRRAQRSPGWAVGGWFIPIGNFYLPYQSARDIFTPREQGRSLVKRWWAAYLVALTLNEPLGRIAGLTDRSAVAVAVAAFALVIWLYAAFKANEFIDEATSSLAGAE